MEKEIKIEYLFLDLNTCDRCIGTDGVLDEVVDVLRPVLELAGYQVIYQKQEITNVQLARKYRFLSSPTILVNGQDIFGTIAESDCGCCGDIAGVQVDCRVFEHDGKTYEVPTKEMLVDAILRTLYNPSSRCCEAYQLPENLKRFFEGKTQKTASSCCCGPVSKTDAAACCCSTNKNVVSMEKSLKVADVEKLLRKLRY